MNTESMHTPILVQGCHVWCLLSAARVLVTPHRVVISTTFRRDLDPAPGTSSSVEIRSVDICRSLISIQTLWLRSTITTVLASLGTCLVVTSQRRAEKQLCIKPEFTGHEASIVFDDHPRMGLWTWSIVGQLDRPRYLG